MTEDKERQDPFPAWMRNPEMLVALSAILLSVCGLFVAVYEASLMRQTQRSSVWPHVQVGMSATQHRLALHVQNTGVGPARIIAGALYYNGEKQKNWQALLRHFLGEKADSVAFNQSLLNGTVLPTSSQSQYIFELTSSDDGEERELISELRQAIIRGDIDVTVCYSSVFNECWTSSLGDLLGRYRGEVSAASVREAKDCDSAPRSEI